MPNAVVLFAFATPPPPRVRPGPAAEDDERAGASWGRRQWHGNHRQCRRRKQPGERVCSVPGAPALPECKPFLVFSVVFSRGKHGTWCTRICCCCCCWRWRCHPAAAYPGPGSLLRWRGGGWLSWSPLAVFGVFFRVLFFFF